MCTVHCTENVWDLEISQFVWHARVWDGRSAVALHHHFAFLRNELLSLLSLSLSLLSLSLLSLSLSLSLSLPISLYGV